MTAKKKSNRGGARPGSGRKPLASPRKLRDSFFENLNTTHEVKELNTMWQLFKKVAQEKAHAGDTEDLQWIFSRIIPVPKEQDIKIDQDVTSGGKSLVVGFTFQAEELSDWKHIPETIKVR